MKKSVLCGDVEIGGESPVSIQSMTNTKTSDVVSTVEQIRSLEEAGCQIVRVAVPDMDAAEALKEIKNKARIPVVADIHFDYNLALAAMESGADKIRINPGNIGSEEGVQKGQAQLLVGHQILVASQVCTSQIWGLGFKKVAPGWSTLAFK